MFQIHQPSILLRIWLVAMLLAIAAHQIHAFKPSHSHFSDRAQGRQSLMPLRAKEFEPGSREDDIQSKIEMLRSAKKQGQGYEKFLGKSRGETMGNTLKKMDRDSAGGKTLSQEELKMKKDKQLYEGAATDLAAQLNTGKFRRQAAEDNKDNIDLFQDPDSFRRQYEAMEDLREDEEEGWQKKKGLALQMAELDRLMAQSEQAFNSREATQATEALMAAEEAAAAAAAQPKESPPARSTSGVGGTWAGAAAEGGGAGAGEQETLKPKVSTWGVFERPKDISKAYGGGRRIGVGGFQMSAEERQRRDEETRRLLEEALQGSAAERELEEEHAEEIDAAMGRVKRLLQFGDRWGALEELEGVRPWLNPKSERGGRALLELGMVLESAKRQQEAVQVYNLLYSKSRIGDIKKNAKALSAGIAAINDMNFKTAEYESQWIWDFPEIQTENRYASGYVQDRDADGVPASTNEAKSVTSARFTLLNVFKYRKGISAQRIVKALKFLQSRSDEMLKMADGKEEIPSLWLAQVGDCAAEGLPARLNGTWALGAVCRGDVVSYPAAGAGFLTTCLDGQTLVRKFPYGIASLEQEGSYVFEEKSRKIKTQYESSKLVAGFIKTPWSSTDEQGQGMELVLLDRELCVTREVRGSGSGAATAGECWMVWRRETAAEAGVVEGETDGMEVGEFNRDNDIAKQKNKNDGRENQSSTERDTTLQDYWSQVEDKRKS